MSKSPFHQIVTAKNSEVKVNESTMEVKVDENDLKAAGAELLTGDGRLGIRIHGWEIETLKRSILKSSTAQEYALF